MLRGYSKVVFPDICICCGCNAVDKERHICAFCLKSRFEPANPGFAPSASGIIMPERVLFQHALWKFDKGGALQDLLHMLKYEHLTEIGIQIGRRLGRDLQKLPLVFSDQLEPVPLLVPVPLHYLKFRKRGFNQAFKIAQGVRRVFPFPICDVRAVVRTRNTRSQTGFSINRRIKNVEGAFKVRDRQTINNRRVIIVDDVFTTGATAFELAGELRSAGAESIGIATVAQA